jgi:hypothetical protein
MPPAKRKCKTTDDKGSLSFITSDKLPAYSVNEMCIVLRRINKRIRKPKPQNSDRTKILTLPNFPKFNKKRAAINDKNCSISKFLKNAVNVRLTATSNRYPT